jgi:hypothetical protein
MLAMLAACESSPVKVVSRPATGSDKLGKAQGSACGSLGLLATAYYAIPLGLNSRVERAYERALASVPGATSLTDVTMQENWYWWVLGTVRCVTISGEAMK